MKQKFFYNSCRAVFAGAGMFLTFQHLEAQNNNVSIDWNKTIIISKTTATLQLVENPMVRNNSPIHKQTFNALKELGADYVRYVPWFPYPKMSVAELKSPAVDKTYWDFTYLDSTMQAFMEATNGHSVIINFSTTPAWMWKTDAVVNYPADPYQTSWDYNQGTQLRDTTMKEVSGYFARLVSWYTKGGFTDELGKFHKSGHFYKIPYWEVLNEPDLEHNISPQLYTKMYDAIVMAIKKVSPETKFVGLALAYSNNPEWFEYFLNRANHKKGVPLDGISYHFYGGRDNAEQPLDSYQYSFFNQADGFLNKVRYIENIRKRLAPHTFTTLDEIGNILSRDGDKPIPPAYWNLSGAMYAYIYLELSKMGIDAAGESQLVGYPTQFPSVSMMNWENGKPNARYWILKLLEENFGPGDKLVSTQANAPGVIGQGFVTKDGKKLLLINKTDKEVSIDLPAETNEATINYVDITTGDNPPSKEPLHGRTITLNPFAVAAVTFKN
ncbi:MAG: glycosyl hydrolase family 39 [Ginsengibacter sp.]